jgi:hypothetical protein
VCAHRMETPYVGLEGQKRSGRSTPLHFMSTKMENGLGRIHTHVILTAGGNDCARMGHSRLCTPLPAYPSRSSRGKMESGKNDMRMASILPLRRQPYQAIHPRHGLCFRCQNTRHRSSVLPPPEYPVVMRSTGERVCISISVQDCPYIQRHSGS